MYIVSMDKKQDFQYTPLIDTNSIPGSSIVTIDSINSLPYTRCDHLCRDCINKLAKKQDTSHTQVECLSHRCQSLEDEVIRLKDHDTKSRLLIRDLENKINELENAVKGLTAPKEAQATPFSFGTSSKLRRQVKKSHSVEMPPQKSEITYDNILQPKRSSSRERVGLFGSLGAASQKR